MDTRRERSSSEQSTILRGCSLILGLPLPFGAPSVGRNETNTQLKGE